MKEQQNAEQMRLQVAALEAAANSILITNAKGRIEWVNPAFCSMTGYDFDEVLGRTPNFLKSGKQSPAFYAELWSTISAGKVWSGQLTNLRKNGQFYEEEMTISPVLSETGTILHFVAIKQDVSARKRQEEEAQKLASLVEHSYDFISVATLEGQTLYVNPAGRLMTGIALGAPLPERISDFHTEKSWEVFQQSCLPEMARAGHWEGESRFRNFRNQKEIVVQMGVFQVRSADTGQPLCLCTISRDITEHKLMELALLEATSAAGVANKAKSEFLANMSHEIRTPMNGVIGMIELALDLCSTEEQSEYLHLAKSSADSLLALLNDILDFSKIEAGKLQLESIDFALRDFLEATLKSHSISANKKHLELTAHVRPDLPDNLLGDPSRLRQILNNLLGNALKFTTSGEVGVRVEPAEEGEDFFHFAVHDSGPGVPAEKQKTIFEAFTQADNSVNRVHGGTGLGLTISSRLAKMMGGKIWLESAPSHGSTFHFVVRLGLSKNLPAKYESVAPDFLRGLPVLVVDDNSTNRRILEETLKGWDMNPCMVDGGAAALEACERAETLGKRFPLILLDARMPGIDGFEVAQRFKQRDPGGATKIVMLTSAGVGDDAARCREIGIDAYLNKPVGRADLLETIKVVLGGRSARDAKLSLNPRNLAIGPHQALHVLLAEDNAVNQTLAIRLLEKRGHTVMVAGTGTAALELLNTQEFDVILMDIQMPEMDGLSATAAIRERERRRGGHIPIIAMTANAMVGDKETYLASGMDGYVSKPINAQELFALIEALPAYPKFDLR